MGIFSGLFRSRDKPKDSYDSTSYSYFFGRTHAGKRVNDRMNELADTIAKVAERLKASPADILAKTEANLAELRKTHQSIEKLKEQLMAGQTDRMLFGAKSVCGLNVLTITNGPVTAEDIRKLGDILFYFIKCSCK